MGQVISITIRGLVQGVYFRQSMREQANALNLTGFVKNLRDGSVYAEAAGSAEDLEKLLDWCRHGPPRARVESVTTGEIDGKYYDGFVIDRSAF